MFDRILLPTDGSDVAENAAEAAVALADRFDAALHVVHVLDVGELPPDYDDGADEGEVAEFEHRGERAAEAAAEDARDAGIDTTVAVLQGSGSPHEAILAYADDHRIDAVVMGTHGRSGLDRFVLGSVAEQTLRDAPIPVLTVHEDTVFDGTIETVLVPTDGSDPAEAAADRAIDLALATDATLHAIHAVDVGAVPVNPDASTVLDALERAGRRAVDSVVERADDAGVSSIRASVLENTPHRAVEDYAEAEDVDVVVMGAHGHTGVERFLLGSTTERVVRHSDVPVLAVPGPDGSE